MDGDTPGQWRIRAGRDTDGPAFIGLMRECWSAYPGIRMDVDGEMPELYALASYYADQNGALWAAQIEGRIVGMVAVRPLHGTDWEVCRVYVDPVLHGSGLAHALLDQAERHAIAAGAEGLTLWSDTRFERAHRFYQKRSYVRHGAIRVLRDISSSLEFGYAKPVNGVATLDIAAATSAVGRLANILIACVEVGAAKSVPPPLAPGQAWAFWRSVASDAGAGKRVIVAAWQRGVLSGTGLLHFATERNQLHRAGVQTVLVHPAHRRSGLGRQILQALEHAAAANGRILLTSRILIDDAGLALYRAQAWLEAGRVPGFARGSDDTAQDAAMFWKQIVGKSTGRLS